MDMENFFFSNVLLGFVLGVLATLFCDFLKKQLYLHRKKGIPSFDLNKCFTFSDNGDDRIFKIAHKTESSIKAEINFSYSDTSCYSGLVLIPSNPFFRPYVKRGAILEFEISLFDVQSICLEFKANIENVRNKVIGIYEIPITKAHHAVVLSDICGHLQAWDDVTELVFLVKKYNISSPAKIEIENVKLLFTK